MLILIADDETGVRTTLSELLKEEHEVVTCTSAEEALQVLEKKAIDLVMTDHQMPGMTGLDLIRRGKELSPQTSFLLMTAYGSVEQAVQALQSGADDYFMKPFEFDEILHRVQRVADLRNWRAEKALKREMLSGGRRLIGGSAFIKQAQQFISKVAPVPSPVLILGPSGTGKEVLAKSIHEAGPRADRPFVAINCASLGEQLMESELFGHEKGAFTGATSSKPGKFELAAGGTLFLDEIGELSPSVQAKLLRVLQEKEFFRVGGVRQIKTDARVIAATHRPLKEMVKEGAFREDLFFRLNVLTFEMAPLNQRPEDLPVLIDFFWEKHSRDLGRKVRLSEEARALLLAYPFPGNVRELQNVLERLIVLGPETGVVGPENLPTEISRKSSVAIENRSVPTNDRGSFDQVIELGLTNWIDQREAEIIRQAMESTSGNQVRAAELLRINRGTLQYKLKKYGIGQAEAA